MGNIGKVYTEVNDETKPAGNRARSLGDDDIREFKRIIRERLAEDHQFAADETGLGNIGTHKKITFSETQGSDPTAYDDCGYLYIKTVSAVKELFWKGSAGSALQITSGGYLKGSNIRLENNTYLKAKDAAGTGTVDLIKANASDKVVIPDASELASDAAPTTDVQIPNKKYVDNAIDTDIAAIPAVTKITLGIDSGTVSALGGSDVNITFNFTFVTAPVLAVTITGSDGNHFLVFIKSISTTGAVIRHENSSTETAYWIAIGTKA